MSGFTLKTYRVSGLKRPQIPTAYLNDMMTMGDPSNAAVTLGGRTFPTPFAARTLSSSP